MLDLRTLALITMMSSVVFFLATLAVWRLEPKERSLRHWTMGAMLLAVANLLLGLRGVIPDFLSIVVANPALVLSLGFLYVGTRSLLGLAPGRPWHWVATGTAFLGCVVFTYIAPSFTVRVILMSALNAPFFLASGWLFWRRGNPQSKAIDRLTALIFIVGALLFLVRAVKAPDAAMSANDMATSSWINASPYFYAILSNVWMAIMLTLKVSARLHRQLSEALEHAEATNRDLIDALDFNETIILNSALSMGVYAANGQCTLANDAYAQLVGATCEALLAQNFHAIGSWQKSGLLDDCLAALAHHNPPPREIRLVTSFGKKIWVEYRILLTHLKGENHLLIQFFNLTESKRVEERLHHFAFYDSLTKLPNRRLLLDRIGQALRTSKRQNSHVAVLFLDLNKFKALNDAHGHDVGDQLLIEVANRLLTVVRASDTVARFGGDEFIVLLEGLGAKPDQAAEYAATVTDKIHRALSVEYVLGDIRHQGSASVGIKLFLGGDGDPDQLLKEADRAMYEEKKRAEVKLQDTPLARSLSSVAQRVF